MVSHKKTYASKVRELREKKAWSQEELAAISGVSVRTIQRIESGEVPSKESLKAIASAFDVDVAEFKPDQLTSSDGGTPSTLRHLLRLTTGDEVFGLTAGAEAFAYTNDELKSNDARSKVGDFLDLVKDWSDLWSDLEPSRHIELRHQCSELVDELQDLGLWVFGGKTKSPYKAMGKTIFLNTAVLGIHYADNPTIRRASSFAELLKELVADVEDLPETPAESTSH